MLSKASRLQLLAAHSAIGAVLATDDEERAAAAQLREKPAPVATKDPATCPHPTDQRVAAPTMGHPDRWICPSCGHEEG